MWRVTPVKVGECSVREYLLFADGGQDTRLLYLYVWLLEGPNGPVLVDTGPDDLESFNRATAEYVPGGVRQTPDERTLTALDARGIRPADVTHVVLTHLHADHCGLAHEFANAMVVVAPDALAECRNPAGPLARLVAARGPDAVVAASEGEVVAGISLLPVPVHSPCSQAVIVDTGGGLLALCGDLAYLYENLEQMRPIGWCDTNAWHEAVARLHEAADILVPGHDPKAMDRPWTDEQVYIV